MHVKTGAANKNITLEPWFTCVVLFTTDSQWTPSDSNEHACFPREFLLLASKTLQCWCGYPTTDEDKMVTGVHMKVYNEMMSSCITMEIYLFTVFGLTNIAGHVLSVWMCIHTHTHTHTQNLSPASTHTTCQWVVYVSSTSHTFCMTQSSYQKSCKMGQQWKNVKSFRYENTKKTCIL
jgi:hypothetical protein